MLIIFSEPAEHIGGAIGPQILAGTLTLFQSGRSDYAHHITTCPPLDFQTFLRSWFYNAFRYLGNKNVFPCRNFWHDNHVPFYHQLRYDLSLISSMNICITFWLDIIILKSNSWCALAQKAFFYSKINKTNAPKASEFDLKILK